MFQQWNIKKSDCSRTEDDDNSQCILEATESVSRCFPRLTAERSWHKLGTSPSMLTQTAE